MKKLIVGTLVGSLSALAVAAVAEVQQPKLLSSQAKLSMQEAEKIALRAVAGKTTEIELQRENGNLIFSVHIQHGAAFNEVEVDAISGKVREIENSSH